MNKNSPETTAKQKEVMLTALEANYGNVSKAAKLAKINPATHYRWRKEDGQYAGKTDIIRDIGYRNLKEHLIESGLRMINKGNITVLNKMMGIFLKSMPEEMKILRLNNEIPIRMVPKFISTPQDPRREGYVKPTEE